MFKLDLEKAGEPEIKLPTSIDHRKSKRVPEKHLLLLYWPHQSLWLCGSQQTVENSERWEYQTTLPVFWETCKQDKKQQLDLDMEQQTGSKSGKEYIKAVYRSRSNSYNWTWNNRLVQNQERSTSRLCILSPCLFNLYTGYIMRNSGLDEAQAGIKIARRNINNLR